MFNFDRIAGNVLRRKQKTYNTNYTVNKWFSLDYHNDVQVTLCEVSEHDECINREVNFRRIMFRDPGNNYSSIRLRAYYYNYFSPSLQQWCCIQSHLSDKCKIIKNSKSNTMW